MNDPYKNLLEALYSKTCKGAISWFPTSLHNEYQANIGDGAITLYYNANYEGTPTDIHYRASFLNERGENFKNVYGDNENDEYFDILSKLHKVANDSYYKIDETLTSMFDTLSKL